ncbi:polysaccharide pyruvyl transferase family protein [Bacillus safensis]|uniref:polysaccharide pyruvyl transferase family protein n=1 Tax=Bacillus safensis TaxID=561879 RepID=UPI001CCD8E0F|nr:polysaccharide pyruvyl transferase family protein [Bacillus safensis]MBZ9520524.1 polysaccharide pyruvyl transferase family protein [Bacillus safensis]
MGLTVQQLKAKTAEWLLLKVKYPLEYRLSRQRLPELSQQKKIILTLLPGHDNLGDHAIAYASYCFLKKHFPAYNIIEVDMKEIYRLARPLKRSRHPEDIVCMIGGGNMGDLYRYEEWTRQFIIKTFKSYPMIQLPATVHFTETKRGKREEQRAIHTYSQHPRLLLMARDQTTYEWMKLHFPDQDVWKQPDMVLSLDESSKDETRKGVLLCLREDQEAYLTKEERQQLQQHIQETYDQVGLITTTIGRRVDRTTRLEELTSLWTELKQAQVVVTDRLHGMIFCAITHTPCVVLRSFDHKVMEGFEWVAHLPFMTLLKEPNEAAVKEAVHQLMKTSGQKGEEAG